MAEQNKKDSPASEKEELHTDWPLCEKDEQAQAIERTRKLQEEAEKRRREEEQKE